MTKRCILQGRREGAAVAGAAGPHGGRKPRVHGIDLRRAVLEQTIREPARGRAHIGAHESGDINGKGVQRAFEFFAAA